MKTHVLKAILKRNFVSYFASPTGYVFICVFVLLSSFAAFWPNEFFNNNLANLDQLNKYLPYIMLVFIPAITMSIWAEERRQGTDELLLTIPAGDFDVVMGKYLAAVAIYTVALLFSMIANGWVLIALAWPGNPDVGLLIGTYVGYWFIGLAMLAVGMVASFLTGNLTVGFILGALFNAPMAFAAAAEVIMPPAWAGSVKRWSLSEQLRDFERGVLSLSSASYFVMITIVMLYLSIVLIGRRHWRGGRDGDSMLGHYVLRAVSLVVAAVAISVFFSQHDVRFDVTSERLSSLSPDTRKLIRELDAEHPVVIEAYVSPQVPAEYAQTRLNLISTLDELDSLGSGKVKVVTHVIENFSEEAVLAEQKYDIKPQTVLSVRRGARTQEDIYQAVVMRCGLDKVVLPFIDKGIPVEYELVRSICTVAQQERKKVGVVRTDASLFGTFNMQTMSPTEDAMLITELKKQYDVVEVDPSSPIQQRYDVLLAVQPSSLAPEQMQNFIEAVKSGQPTAIFEDPFPLPNFYPNVAGTAQQKRPPMNPMMMGRQPPPPPKGDISQLWDLLDVDLEGNQVVWQDYNPYPKGEDFITPQWVFIDRGAGAAAPFNEEHPITSQLQQVLFIFPGAWNHRESSDMKFTQLATTGEQSGTISYQDIMQLSQRSPVGTNLSHFEIRTGESYVLAAQIQGKLAESGGLFSVGETDEPAPSDESDTSDPSDTSDTSDTSDESDAPEDPEVNVVLVADIDCLASAFFFVRAQGEEEDAEIAWSFDNVTFVLNVLDNLADDDRYIDIRKRRRAHRTLRKVEQRTEEARTLAMKQRKDFIDQFQQARDEANRKFSEQVEELRKREDLDERRKMEMVRMIQNTGQRRLDIRIAQLEDKRDKEVKRIERELALKIRSVQDRYKLFAVLLPPIPPLLVGFFVFFHRRQLEREGVAKSRLK